MTHNELTSDEEYAIEHYDRNIAGCQREIRRLRNIVSNARVIIDDIGKILAEPGTEGEKLGKIQKSISEW